MAEDNDRWEQKIFSVTRGTSRLGSHAGVASTVDAVHKIRGTKRDNRLAATLNAMSIGEIIEVGNGVCIRRQECVEAPILDPEKLARSNKPQGGNSGD